jgi:muramoyltetrapeptide carboxypeptidase
MALPTAWLCCPAYPMRDRDHLERAIAAAEAFCGRIGHRLVVAPSMNRFGTRGLWIAPELRRADLASGLDHDLIIAGRGGYACVDLIDLVLGHARPLPRILGFSDLTVLHACWRKRGAVGVYGWMPGAEEFSGERAAATAAALLRNEAGMMDDRTGGDVIATGTATGWLFPATLRVLAGLIGTAAMPSLDGAILALEDIGEAPYRIDRDLWQLQAAGCFAGVRGLVFGKFPWDRPKDQDPAADDARGRATIWCARLGLPGVFGAPFGHTKDPIALPCGHQATLHADGRGWRLAWAAGR